MKKSLILLLLCLNLSSLLAEKKFLKESIMVYGDQSKQCRLFLKYNENDSLVLCNFEFLTREGVWKSTKRKQYLYNSNNRRLSYRYEQNYDINWHTSVLDSFAYDDNGNQVLYIHSLGDNQGIKISREYDTRNNLLSETTFIWDGANSKRYSRITYEYDAQNNLVVLTNENYDYDKSKWMPYSKYEYFYDNKNRKVIELSYTYSFNKQVPGNRITIEYNNNDQIVSKNTEAFMDEWFLINSQEFKYDDKSRKTFESTERFDIEGNSMSRFEHSIVYNAEGLLVEDQEIVYTRDKINYGTRFEYTYYSDGKLKSHAQISCEYNLDWYKRYLYELEYDEATRDTAILIYSIGIGNNWKPQNKTSYIYFPNGKIKSKTKQWLDTSANWKDVVGDFYELDSNGYLSSFTHFTVDNSGRQEKKEIYVNDSYGNVLSTRYQIKFSNGFEDENKIWIFDDIPFDIEAYLVVFTYKEALTNAGESYKNLSDFSVYPNPASAALNINYKLEEPSLVSITLSDMSGNEQSILQERFSSSAENEINYTLMNLTSGTYFIKLSAGSETITKKIVILR